MTKKWKEKRLGLHFFDNFCVGGTRSACNNSAVVWKGVYFLGNCMHLRVVQTKLSFEILYIFFDHIMTFHGT